MKIQPKNSGIHQLWVRATQHFITSFTTFLLSFFIILYSGLKEAKLSFLFENEFAFPLLCSGITIIANLFLIILNYDDCSLREIEYDEYKKNYTITFRKGYSNKNQYKIARTEDIKLSRRSIKNILGDSTNTIKMTIPGKRSFIFSLDDVIWSTDKQALRDLYALIK